MFVFGTALFLFCSIAPLAASANDPPRFVRKWGQTGTAAGQFEGPSEIAVGPDGNIYVGDSGHGMQMFSPDGSYVRGWNAGGNAIAFDAEGLLYIAAGDKVEIYENVGVTLPMRLKARWDRPGSGDGQFRNAQGIALDALGNVYVSDWFLHRVQKFDSSGNFIQAWGGSGTGDGELFRPVGMAVDAGFLYVVESDGNRVSKFDLDGTFVTNWGTLGIGPGEFERPDGVTTDAEGRVYVAEGHRIQVFQPDGTYITEFGSLCFMESGQFCIDPDGDGPLELGDGQFDSALDVDVDADGAIYVADRDNDRVQVFRWTPTGIAPARWESVKSRYRD